MCLHPGATSEQKRSRTMMSPSRKRWLALSPLSTSNLYRVQSSKRRSGRIFGNWGMVAEPENLQLGAVARIKHGFAFDGSHFVEEPTGDVLVTPGNFEIGGGFKLGKSKYYQG